MTWNETRLVFIRLNKNNWGSFSWDLNLYRKFWALYWYEDRTGPLHQGSRSDIEIRQTELDGR